MNIAQKVRRAAYWSIISSVITISLLPDNLRFKILDPILKPTIPFVSKTAWYENRVGQWEDNRVSNDKIQTLTRISYYKYDQHPPNPVFYFLNFSHNITTKCLQYKKMREDKLDIEKVLASGYGDCVNFSEITYSNFVYLAKKSGNFDILDSVRIAEGTAKLDTAWTKHEWVEFNYLGRWFPYECTASSQTNEEVYRSILISRDNAAALDFMITALQKEYNSASYFIHGSNGKIYHKTLK